MGGEEDSELIFIILSFKGHWQRCIRIRSLLKGAASTYHHTPVSKRGLIMHPDLNLLLISMEKSLRAQIIATHWDRMNMLLQRWYSILFLREDLPELLLQESWSDICFGSVLRFIFWMIYCPLAGITSILQYCFKVWLYIWPFQGLRFSGWLFGNDCFIGHFYVTNFEQMQMNCKSMKHGFFWNMSI